MVLAGEDVSAPDWRAFAEPELGLGPVVAERVKEFREWLVSVPSDMARECIISTLFCGLCRYCASESPCSCSRDE